MKEVSLKERAIEIFTKSGRQALDEFLQGVADPEARIQLCADLLIHSYWEQKDLAMALSHGKRGLEWWRELQGGEGRDGPGASSATEGTVKSIHYNIASFTWPGWDEPGIVLGDEELDLGLHSARMNLQFAQELQKGPLAEARAQWLLACHLMARGESSQAVAHFESSMRLFRNAGNAGEELMSMGFLQMTRILGGEPGVGSELQETLERLAECDGGSAFVSQIETALRYFQGGGRPGRIG